TMVDTVVAATGSVTVNAVSGAHIAATISNNAEADSTGKKPTKATGINAVVAQNKVSDKATASISYATHSGQTDVQAGNGISVTATDQAQVNATITLATTADSKGQGANTALGALGVGGAGSLNDVRGGASASGDKGNLLATARALLVSAQETAGLTPHTHRQLLASSAVLETKWYRPFTTGGPGSSLAAGGLLSTNVVQSAAEAKVTGGSLTTRASGGDVTVTANNAASLDAKTINGVTAFVTNQDATLAN